MGKNIVHLGRDRLLEILREHNVHSFDRDNLATVIDALPMCQLIQLRDTMVSIVRETKQNNRG